MLRFRRPAAAAADPDPARAVAAAVLLVAQSPGRARRGPPGRAGNAGTVAQVERLYGLDQPWYVQYGKFLVAAVQLDFGNSINTRRPVTEEMLRLWPATFELAMAAMIFAVGLGFPRLLRGPSLWTLAGQRVGVGSPCSASPSRCSSSRTSSSTSSRSSSAGCPPGAAGSPPRCRASHRSVRPGWHHHGNLPATWDAILHLILPAIALGSIPLAIIVRITRASVLDVVHEDYVRTAEAKGLLERTITPGTMLRNALLPVVTVIGLTAGLLLSGAILTETVFAWHGVGRSLPKRSRSVTTPCCRASSWSSRRCTS